MSLAASIRIGLDLEEPLASRVDVLSITTTYRLIGLKLIQTAGQTTKCKKYPAGLKLIAMAMANVCLQTSVS